MHPYLFSIPLWFRDEPFHLRSFGVLVACGFLFGANILQRLARKYDKGEDPDSLAEKYSGVLMWALFGVFGGARVMYVIVEVLRDSSIGQRYLDEPLSMLYFWEGGLVMYGGFAGGAIMGVLKAKLSGLNWIRSLDMALISAMFAQGVGRWGCLLVGDDFGKVVPERFQNLPFPITVHVPNPLPEGSLFGAENAGQILWATQTWMSFNGLIIGLIGLWLLAKRRYAGQVTLWLIVFYAIGRYAIEMFRGDAIRGLWFNGLMSTSQLISVVAGSIALIVIAKFRNRQDPDLPTFQATE
ncbi:MAG: phosphatidylglycerol:prolipoprotein diacylglycerol transferase [Planctomycetota bacterium]|jgi:phosphatidylglycerol:prolipoprotein diacylglycerol transferase